VEEHETDLVPSFALVEPGERMKPDTCRLLGLVCPPGVTPTGRVRGEAWAATPVDRVARLCRAHGVELGLVTDGRWWTLVWAPRGGVTTTATFDTMTWPERADRDVVRAFRSLLCRSRFFAVPDDETLVPLLRRSLEGGEEVTEALGTQVRRAVELLVEAFSRHDTRARERGEAGLGEAGLGEAGLGEAGLGEAGLGEVPAMDVYRGAVAVMMRVVFLLFAEERGLLPADNELYFQAYSAGRLCEVLERRAREGSEEDLEHSSSGWLRLLALFAAVHSGVEHQRLRMPAYDGSIFDPVEYPWLDDLRVDDRTVMHMLRAVQYVVIGKERRRLSFRALDVEQIGYVYEGLLSFEGRRASETVVGLVGKLGLEEEVPLTELEKHGAAVGSVDALAERLAEAYKDSKIGTPRALAKRLAPLNNAERAEALRRLLAATSGDAALAERLLPFQGIIRTDLRGLPVVIAQDALYVTESRLRQTTGTHYTPRFLAEKVVEGALQPLVYSPGPLQTADESAWRPISSERILELNVADPAMGSGAFLVSACRYLAERLVEAWSREGNDKALRHVNEPSAADTPADAEADPVVVEARREIIQHCLYGVDINAMAVEMAKLSLWLISMDPKRPFTFLDDHLATGDSLLGITSMEQLKYMHLDVAKGRRLHPDEADWVFTVEARRLVAELIEDRRELTDMPGDTLEDLSLKRKKLLLIREKTRDAWLLGDLAVGAALAAAGRGDRVLRDNAMAAAHLGRLLLTQRPDALDAAKAQATQWLSTDRPAGGFEREPLHWPLVFPEVFERGGFDAIVSNQPYLGGPKVGPALGKAYRNYLATNISDVRGTNIDLVAYFVVRANGLINSVGQTGLVATNTLAQGDTRAASLDRLTEIGTKIRRATKSQRWPSRSSALEYCEVWTTKAALGEDAVRLIDGRPTEEITSSLDPIGRVSGPPSHLAANLGMAYIGHHVNGLGFLLTVDEACALVNKDKASNEVIYPYLNGEDLNSRPDTSAGRRIINFRDLNLSEAENYPECLDVLRRLVKPVRETRNRQSHRRLWWRFADYRRAMEDAIEGLGRVVAITLVSKVVMPVMVPTGQVFAHRLGIFATGDPGMLALLSSAPHCWWAITRSSTLETRTNYTPTDVFETFARPEVTVEMRELGERLDAYRRENVMLARNAGLTATYNLVHDPGCTDADIAGLRDIHVAIDEAVTRAYGWDDLALDHGFQETRQGTRFTVGPVVRQEILDRLLELNQERYAAEVAAGLHDKKKSKRAQEGLFDA
jgi:Eco57I restriction-modification methylase/restriction-modification enzyme MmeI-like protein